MQKIPHAVQGIVIEIIYALAIMLCALIIGAVVLFIFK
jgi:hypothetical protein